MWISRCVSVGVMLSLIFFLYRTVSAKMAFYLLIFLIYMLMDWAWSWTGTPMVAWLGTLWSITFYADDLVLICPSLNGLQKLVDICSEFSTSHEIVFNSKKTVCMSFLPSSLKFARPFKLLLQGQRLSFKSDCKYLGVFLCDDRTDDLDLNRQLRSFYVRCNYLMRNFNSCSQEVKCLLFNTFCGNFYSGHCWSSYKRASMSKLVVGFNNSFRRLMSYPRFCSASSMYVFNHVCSFNEILRKSIYSFRERILNSQNSIICTLARFTLHSPLWKLWHHHLFSFWLTHR